MTFECSFLGNFRSSLMDCKQARKFKPDHFKAIVRGVLGRKGSGRGRQSTDSVGKEGIWEGETVN